MRTFGNTDGLLELHCAGVPESAGVARRFVRDALMAMEVPAELVERAVLVTSELATNAIVHARTAFVLRVHQVASIPALTVSVSDQAATIPVPRVEHPGQESGRGLAVVEGFSSAWGVRIDPNGKSVWAEFRDDF